MIAIAEKESLLHRAMRAVFYAWVFLLVLALYPYTSDPAAPIKYLISAVAAVVLSTLGVVATMRHPETARRVSPLLWLLGAFLAVNLLAAALSDYPSNSLNATRPWIVFSLIAFHAAHVFTREEHAWRLLAAFTAAAALSSLYGFSQYFGFDPFPWSMRDVEEYYGLPSTYANPNFAGHTLVMALLMTLGAAWRSRAAAAANAAPGGKGWRRHVHWGFLLFAALIGGHLYLTRMRGVRVALAAAAALIAVFAVARRRIQNPLRAAVATLLFLGLGAGLLAAAAFAAAVSFAPHRKVPIDGSLALRLNGYYGAAQMALHHPVLGVGPGNYTLENIRYWTPYEKRWYATEGKKNLHVHCDVLEAGTDAGLPGIALYLALLIWGLLAGLRIAADPTANTDRRKFGLTLAMCCAAFTVDGFFGFNLRVPVSAGIFFLLLGLLQGLSNADRPVLRRRTATAMQAAALLLALTATFFEARAFRGERQYQRALGAVYWANDFAKKNDVEGERRMLRAAYTILSEGRLYLPWDARFPESQGQLDLRERRFDAAIARFREAVARHPYHPGMHINLAQAHINRALESVGVQNAPPTREQASFLRHLEDAEAAARRAITLCDTLPEAYEAAGRVAMLHAVTRGEAGGDAAGAWAEAEDLLLAALRHGTPNRAPVQRMLAQCMEQTGRIVEAETYLKRALESDPLNDETIRIFRTFAHKHARPDACIDALSRALGAVRRMPQATPDQAADIAFHLAEMYLGMTGRPELAQAVVQELIERAPNRLDLWGVEVRGLPREDRLSAVKAAYERRRSLWGQAGVDPDAILQAVAALDPGDANAMLRTARLLAESSEMRKTQRDADTVARELSWIADILVHQLAQALPSQEARGPVLAALGRAYLAAARWDAAERLLHDAVPLLSGAERGAALAQHSEALAALQRRAQALQTAEEAVRLLPASAAVRLNYARRLRDAGRITEARFEYRALLEQQRGVPLASVIRTELDALERDLAATIGGAPS